MSSGVDVQVVGVDAGGEVVERGKDHRAAGMLEQLRVGGRTLQDCTTGRQGAEQGNEAALRLDRLGARADDGAVDRVAGGLASRSPSVSPVTVMHDRSRSGASSRSTASSPPAANRSSI